MKIRNVFAFFLAALFFSSCGKEKGADNKDDLRVKSYTEEVTFSGQSLSMTYNLSYDGEKRITAITPVNFNDGKITFTYHSKDKYSMNLITEGKSEIHEDFFLKNSLLDSTVQFNNSKDTMSEKYYYNEAKQLTGKDEFEHNSGPHLTNSIQYNYDGAGNMIKSTERIGNVETFTYFPDLVYATPVIAPFFSQLEKSQLIKSRQLSRGGVVIQSVVTTYTFDSKDRIQSIKETSDDGAVVTKSFTYF